MSSIILTKRQKKKVYSTIKTAMRSKKVTIQTSNSSVELNAYVVDTPKGAVRTLEIIDRGSSRVDDEDNRSHPNTITIAFNEKDNGCGLGNEEAMKDISGFILHEINNPTPFETPDKTDEKIFVPSIAEYREDKNQERFYVHFPKDKHAEFKEFCKQNNIGNGEKNRKDVVAGELSVYSTENLFVV